MPGDWNGPSGHCTQPSGDRRMSEPTRGHQTQRNSPPVPPRPRSAQLLEHHPNQEVILDEVGEGEMVENKLVIPDEMMQYLNQVSRLSRNRVNIFVLNSIGIYSLISRCSSRFKLEGLRSTVAAVPYLSVSRRSAPILCTINARCSLPATTANPISRSAILNRNLLNRLARITRTLLRPLTTSVPARDLRSPARNTVLHPLIRRNRTADKC